jgi:phenol/toluene 2-monooxygenase (NADH) P3/A3
MSTPRKLSMKKRYSALTRDLDWTPSYVDPKAVRLCQ